MNSCARSNRWHDLAPWQSLNDASLDAITAYVQAPSTAEALAALARSRSYPHHICAHLHTLGLANFFAEDPTHGAGSPGCLTLAHFGSLCHVLASADISLAITVAINALAFLPLYIAADPDLLAWAFAQIQAGKFGAMLLTELASGSNVLGGQTWAESGSLNGDGAFVSALEQAGGDRRGPNHFRLFGQKDLINGGGEHELLIVFARTGQRSESLDESGPLGARSDFSFLLVERDSTVTSPYRWHTLPAAGANIASVAFHGTIVPRHRAVGRVGSGFALAQKALAISRGEIGALAAGLGHRAVSLATRYAQERAIFGAPILELGAIADHLMRMQALDLLVTAAALRASAMLNARGPDAAHYGAVAKYACSVLVEAMVDEGRYLMGSRALLLDHPYHQLIGDVPLLSAFDGTTHLVLDQLQWRLAQVAAMEAADQPEWLPAVAAIYRMAPRSIPESTRTEAGLLLIHPAAYLRQLAEQPGELLLEPLLALVEGLLTLTRHCRANGMWEDDQGLRFEFGKLFAYLETLIALVELADSRRRRQLVMVPIAAGTDVRALASFAYAWFGGQQAAALGALSARLGQRSSEPITAAQFVFGRLMTTTRDAIRHDRSILTQGYA